MPEYSIVGALQQTPDMRVAYGKRWLIWEHSWWEVWEKRTKGGAASLLVQTEDEGEAVQVLVAGRKNNE